MLEGLLRGVAENPATTPGELTAATLSFLQAAPSSSRDTLAALGAVAASENCTAELRKAIVEASYKEASAGIDVPSSVVRDLLEQGLPADGDEQLFLLYGTPAEPRLLNFRTCSGILNYWWNFREETINPQAFSCAPAVRALVFEGLEGQGFRGNSDRLPPGLDLPSLLPGEGARIGAAKELSALLSQGPGDVLLAAANTVSAGAGVPERNERTNAERSALIAVNALINIVALENFPYKEVLKYLPIAALGAMREVPSGLAAEIAKELGEAQAGWDLLAITINTSPGMSVHSVIAGLPGAVKAPEKPERKSPTGKSQAAVRPKHEATVV